jgi:hypothetical protein
LQSALGVVLALEWALVWLWAANCTHSKSRNWLQPKLTTVKSTRFEADSNGVSWHSLVLGILCKEGDCGIASGAKSTEVTVNTFEWIKK